jgi:cytochrome c oxidase subunit III
MHTPIHAEQFESLERQSDTLRFGMWVFLASELLLFSGFFVLYAAYRGEYGSDFVAALHQNTLAFGTANTYVLLTSSFSIALAVRCVRCGEGRSAARWTALSALLGCAFLVIKGSEYAIHIRDGALPGPYYHFARAPTLGGDRFYTLYWITTGAHALHVTGGIGALAWTALQAKRGRYTPDDCATFEMAGLYWHFVDVMWLFIWPIYYLA